jgi:hypothetical protein
MWAESEKISVISAISLHPGKIACQFFMEIRAVINQAVKIVFVYRL